MLFRYNLKCAGEILWFDHDDNGHTRTLTLCHYDLKNVAKNCQTLLKKGRYINGPDKYSVNSRINKVYVCMYVCMYVCILQLDRWLFTI